MPNTDKIIKSWYVLQVHSGRENSVVKLFNEKIDACGLRKYFGDIVVPTEDVVEIKNGKRRTAKQRFLPGYVLANMNINNDVLSLIKDATSIFGFIGGTPTKPQSITEEEVNNILSKVKQSHDSPRPKVMYQVGSVIRVVEGPFADFEATVEQVDYEKNTMKVSVAIFGRPTPVSLSFDNVTSC